MFDLPRCAITNLWQFVSCLINLQVEVWLVNVLNKLLLSERLLESRQLRTQMNARL